VNGGRSWQTNDAMLRFDSPRVDWWWWRGRRWLRRAAAARSRRRASCGSGSGEGESNARQHSAVGARVRSREELGSLGRQRERAQGVLTYGGGNGERRTAGSRVGGEGAAIYSRACIEATLL
jgi:hypothetical protein